MRRSIILAAAMILAAACANNVETSETRVPLTRDGQPVEINRGVYTLYPDEIPAAPKAPAGYKAFYLSQYGRHGSRYLQFDSQYVHIHKVLEKAHEDGKLTVVGEDVRDRFEAVYPQLKGRGGELSPLGQVQQKAIATKIAKDWPGLFRKGSKVVVRSTNLERTMLSMSAFLSRLCELKKGLDLDVDASHLEVSYLNPHTSENPRCSRTYSVWRSDDGEWREAFCAYRDSVVNWKEFGELLFTDMGYACRNFSVIDLEQNLYFFSVGAANTPVDTDFFDLFTKDELEKMSMIEPASFYIMKALYPAENAIGGYLAEVLLNDFLEKADADLQDGVSARIRFGHDGCMASLFALMGINGWDQVTDDLDEIWTIWDTGKLTMASNFQIVFFRNRAGDIILTPLLNGETMSLPLEPVADGFYRWDDFKEHYTKVVDESRKLLDS